MPYAFLQANEQPSDRRQDPRVPRTGRVDICFRDPEPMTVDAELVETSMRGFRIAHDSSKLVPGLEVDYLHATGSGHARVVWTHVLEGRRLSGFLIL
jgi:hypothetical protein